MVANFPLTVIDAYEGADWGMPMPSTWYGRTADATLSSANDRTIISGYQLSPSGALNYPAAMTASGAAIDIRIQTVVPGSDTASGKDIVAGIKHQAASETVVLGRFGDDGNVVFDDQNAFVLAPVESMRWMLTAEIVYIGGGRLAVTTKTQSSGTTFTVLEVNTDEQLELVQDLSSVVEPQKLVLDANNKLHFLSGDPQLLSRLDFDGTSYSVSTVAGSEGFIPALLWQGAIYGQGGPDFDLYKYTEAGGLELVAALTPAGDGQADSGARVLPAGACGGKLFVTYNDVPPGGNNGWHVYNDVAVIFPNGTRGADLNKVVGQDIRGDRSPFTAACAEGFLYIHNGWGPALRVDARTDAPFVETISAFSSQWPSGPSSAVHIYAEAPGVGANSGNAETRVYFSLEELASPPSQHLWAHVQHKANMSELQLQLPHVAANAAGAGGGPIGVCAVGPDMTIAVYDFVGSYSSRSLQIRQIHSDQSTTVLAEGAYTSESGVFRTSIACTYSSTGDGAVYFPFSSTAEGFGRELYYWKSGMTSPSLVVDAVAGSSSGNPQRITLVGDRLFFATTGGLTQMITLPDNTTSTVSPTYVDSSEDASALEMLGAQQTNGDWRAFALVPVEGTSYFYECKLMTMGPSDTVLQTVAGVDTMNCPNPSFPKQNFMAVHEGSLYVAFDNSQFVTTTEAVRGLLRVNPNDLSSEFLEDTSGLRMPKSLVSATNRLYFVAHEFTSGEIAYLDTSVSSPTGGDIHKLTDLSSNGYSATIATFAVAGNGDLFSCISRRVQSYDADQFTVIEPVDGNFTELGGNTLGCSRGGSFCAWAFSTKVGDTNYVIQNTGAFGNEVQIYPPVPDT